MSRRPGLLRRLDRSGAPLLLARLLLGVTFIWMGLAKTGVLKTASARFAPFHAVAARLGVQDTLLSPVDFLKLVREYRMVPAGAWPLLNLTAAALPWLEVLCGLLLIAGVALRGTSLALLVMLIFFTTVVTLRALGIYQEGGIAFCDIKFDCGCGAGQEYICRKVPKNLALTALSLVVLLSRSRRLCLRGDVVPACSMPRNAEDPAVPAEGRLTR